MSTKSTVEPIELLVPPTREAGQIATKLVLLSVEALPEEQREQVMKRLFGEPIFIRLSVIPASEYVLNDNDFDQMLGGESNR